MFTRRNITIITMLIIALFASSTLTACFDRETTTSQQAQQEEKKLETAENLMAKQPFEGLDFSMDRYLLKERLERFNDPNKMMYLYVFTPSGVNIQFAIRGKVASTGKRLSNTVQKYQMDMGNNWGERLGPAPDEMGVYGESSSGAKVGVTTIGSMVEFGGFGFYIYSEMPLSFAGMKTPMIRMEVQATDAEKAALLEKLRKGTGKHVD